MFKFDADCKSTDPRKLMNSQYKKHEEDYSKAHYNQTVRRY